MKKKVGLNFAKILQGIAVFSLFLAANSRCYFVYHQPKQPVDVKKYRKI